MFILQTKKKDKIKNIIKKVQKLNFVFYRQNMSKKKQEGMTKHTSQLSNFSCKKNDNFNIFRKYFDDFFQTNIHFALSQTIMNTKMITNLYIIIIYNFEKNLS